MSGRLFAIVAFGWLLSSWLQLLIADVTTGSSDVDTVFSMQVLEIRSYAFVSVPIPNTAWVSAVGRLLVWDYPWYQGGMQIVRWLLVLPLSAAVFWGLFTGALPVLISAVGQISSGVFNLIGAVTGLRR